MYMFRNGGTPTLTKPFSSPIAAFNHYRSALKAVKSNIATIMLLVWASGV